MSTATPTNEANVKIEIEPLTLSLNACSKEIWQELSHLFTNYINFA